MDPKDYRGDSIYYASTDPNGKAERVVSVKDMELRDYFAAKWMQGYMANPGVEDMRMENMAEKSYLVADAMLAARKL